MHVVSVVAKFNLFLNVLMSPCVMVGEGGQTYAHHIALEIPCNPVNVFPHYVLRRIMKIVVELD